MSDRPHLARPSGVRLVLAAAAGAATAALGALILGEYAFTGLTPYLAGVFFGLVIAEIVLTVARAASRPLAAAAAVEAGLGLAWALWISIGGTAPRHEPVHPSGFVAVALGVAVAGTWVALPTRARDRGD